MKLHELTIDYLRAHPLSDHASGGSKLVRGKVLVIAGSRQVPGAALLAGLSAMRAGAGILQIATVQSAAMAIAVAMPESMVIGCDETPAGDIAGSAASKLADFAADSNAVLIGPGMLDEVEVAALTRNLLQAAERPQFVLDAAAFTSLRHSDLDFNRHAGRISATPHAGEMAKYLDCKRDSVEADMLEAGRRAAAATQAVVAMKGAETHIVDPNGTAWLSRHGSIALATSGSGDTLAGILSGLLARGTERRLAMLWAVYLHAEAGRRLALRHGAVGALAREIPAEIPAIMSEFATLA